MKDKKKQFVLSEYELSMHPIGWSEILIEKIKASTKNWEESWDPFNGDYILTYE